MPKDTSCSTRHKAHRTQRQLTAIRMFLQGEDDLAVHTVAAAAYKILRDIKRRRGRNEAADFWKRGLFSIAQHLASGALSSIPTDVAVFTPLIERLLADIRSGRVRSDEDFELEVAFESSTRFWRTIDADANFLKRADLDSDGSRRGHA